MIILKNMNDDIFGRAAEKAALFCVVMYAFFWYDGYIGGIVCRIVRKERKTWKSY